MHAIYAKISTSRKFFGHKRFIIIKISNVNMFILCDLKGQSLNHGHVAHVCEYILSNFENSGTIQFSSSSSTSRGLCPKIFEKRRTLVSWRFVSDTMKCILTMMI